MSLTTVKRLAIVAAVAALVLYPLIYLGNYAGDAQVHLVYGESAARGGFFEFNPGEPTAGVTSPGFMLFLAGLFYAAPDSIVPALVKAMNYLAWYGLVLVFFLLARRMLGPGMWALLATLVVGLMPGSVYNSNIGMENGIFGLLVVGWLYYAVRTGWFDPRTGDRGLLLRELGSGGLLGVACWIRPEGYLVAGVALGFKAVLWLKNGENIRDVLWPSTISFVPFAVLAGGLAYFHYSQTGLLLPTSGSSRILMSQVASDTFHLGPLFASPKLGLRMATYFPLALLWLAGNWLFLTRTTFLQQWRPAVGFSLILFWLFFILYSTVLGSTHLARYIIFIMPGLVLVAAAGGQWIWERNRSSPWNWTRKTQIAALSAAPLVLLAIFGLETVIRLGLDSQSSLARSMSAVTERDVYTEELLNQLGADGSKPVSIALQEVQVRYWLDERFVVRSLDGRVDPVLLDHASSTGVDHPGYLKERSVDFLLELPNYNRDKTDWSLVRLTDLSPGESVTRSGLTFTSLTTADQPVNNGCAADGCQCHGRPPSGQAPYLDWFTSVLICIDHQD